VGAFPGIIPSAEKRLGVRLVGVTLLVLWLGVLPGTVGAALVINEFLPDPAGSDGGREFVELLNQGPDFVELDQVSLQFANGAVAVQWLTRWRGTGLGSLAPGSRFLLVDRNWQGEPDGDAEVYLGLQNGPDAIRLKQGAVVLDLVGYGPLTNAELFEGAPAAIAAGLSLARRPDGHDTGSNAADFVVTAPTPGAPNFLPYSVSVDDLDWDPPMLERPGDSLRLSLKLRNDGTEVLPAGPCRLVWAAGTVASWWDGAGPDEEQVLVFVARMTSRGAVPLTWEYPVPGRPDTLRLPLVAVQVGAADLRLNEVLPAPGQRQGEWFEVQWLGGGAVDLAGYRVKDEEGTWSFLPAATLAGEELLVVAQDSLALVRWQEANQEAGGHGCRADEDEWRVLPMAGWPSLNNTPPDGRLYADRLCLADPQGVIIDAVAWGGAGHELPDRGVSLERIGVEPVNPGAANWTVCTARIGSTPGCPNSVTVGADVSANGAVLRIQPPVLDQQGGVPVVHLSFLLASPEVAWELQIFNLWGDGVRDFGGDARGAGPRDLLWDGCNDQGRAVGPGAYLVWLETRSEAGVVQRRDILRMVVR